MQAPFIPAASIVGPQFDLPPIAPPSQIAQQAAPFSQLLTQAQAAPAPPPPPPSPPAPPAPPKANTAPHDAGSSGNGANGISQPPSSTNQANGNDAATKASSPNDGANTPDANQQATHVAGHSQPRAKADGKAAQAEKTGGDHSPQDGTAQNSAENAATAATVLSSQADAKSGDAGKGKKDDDKTGTKSADTSSTSDGASSATPDAGAQAAAAAVSAIATATTPAQDNQAAKPKTDAKQAAKPVATQLNAKNQPAAGLTPASTQPSNGGTLPTDAATVNGAQSHAKSAAAEATSISVTKNTPATASHNDGPTGPAAVPASPLPAVEPVTTVATSEAPAVSTTTLDPSIGAPPAASTENAPPQAGSTPNYAAQNNALSATPSAFATTMAQNAAGTSSADGGLNTIDRARFVQRVASAFQAVGDQGGEIRLRLSPPELGSLQMQISVKQGVLSATIQADNTTAQQALLDSLPDLRDRLAQQDIRIDRFDVQLMGQGSGGMPQPQGNSDFNQPGRRPPPTSNTVATPTTTETNRSPISVAAATNGALNIIV